MPDRRVVQNLVHLVFRMRRRTKRLLVGGAIVLLALVTISSGIATVVNRLWKLVLCIVV